MKKIYLLSLIFALSSCKKAAEDSFYNIDDNVESAQQVGDAMAAIDESGGNTSGAIAYENIQLLNKTKSTNWVREVLLPKAQAISCFAASFSACSSGQKSRDFANCSTSLGGSISGTINLSFSGSGSASCLIPNSGDSVTRIPNYTVSGLRGATFSVSSSLGQTLTRTGATTFEFVSQGVRRSFTTAKGNTLLDMTSETTSAIQVTGGSRNNRSISGGGLRITNNISGVTCTMTPSSAPVLQWTSGCNCPTQGSWTGTCSDSSSFSVEFGSTCGQVTLTKNSDSATVTLDRCQQ